MNTALEHAFVGCVLMTWTSGLIQAMTYCQKNHRAGDRYLVSVCQDNDRTVPSHGGILIIDAAGAPLQQVVDCKCYLSFIHGGSQQHIPVYLFLEMDTNQNITFKVNELVYKTDANLTKLNFTTESMIKFRQENQKYPPRACLGLQIGQTQGSVTMRCEANRHESTRAAATPTRSMPLTPNMTTPFALHTDKDGSTDDLKVILCASIGGGMLLIAICIVVCCAVKRQRRSEKTVSKDSKPNEKYIDKASSPTDSSAEGTKEHSAECRTTQATHEIGRIMTSEYVDVDHCDATARAKYDCKKPTQRDVYNHLNELQPVQHSDNVYSTTHMYKTTKQESRAMPKRGAIDDPSESDVYNNLNEVRLSPHTDNIYNATNVQESGATTSQYDSVELVNRQQNVKLDTDYNVLSFP